jgi:hypothetical protein
MAGALLSSCLALACGGSAFSGVLGAGSDGGSDGAANQSDASPSADAPVAETAAPGDAAAPDVGITADVVQPADVTQPAMDAPAPPCPVVAGAYAITILQVAGCGDMDPLAPQCITQDPQGCSIQFVSQGPGNTAAINGDPTVQSDGSFANGSLKEGSVNRTGCVGSRDAMTSTMTVDCGGSGSSQSCVVALQRTASTCM